MVSYRLLQKFNQHGQSSGYSIEVLVDSSDINDEFPLDAYGEQLDFLEQLRTEILCINSNTSETYARLLENTQDARNAFNEICSALNITKGQYETLKDFLEAQGIKSMANFPVLGVPQLTGELLQDEKKSNEF